MAKKISAKSIVADLKSGSTDQDLMDKYGLSFQELQELFTQLVKAKLASQAYFNKRAVDQAQNKPKIQSEEATCPYCGYSESKDFKICPRCDQDVSEWLDTQELTKMLQGS